jgi:outer membrane protein assembly factor BamD (BamD/ComL family)
MSALGLLAEYDRLFPAGGLRPEATVLRIEALFENGERSSALEAVDRFLASHPGSPHEARLRSLIAQGRVP